VREGKRDDRLDHRSAITEGVVEAETTAPISYNGWRLR
jgi:hypothetical protein